MNDSSNKGNHSSNKRYRASNKRNLAVGSVNGVVMLPDPLCGPKNHFRTLQHKANDSAGDAEKLDSRATGIREQSDGLQLLCRQAAGESNILANKRWVGRSIGYINITRGRKIGAGSVLCALSP